MINTKSDKFQEFLQYIHNEYENKKRRTSENAEYVVESKILKQLLHEPERGPKYWSDVVSRELYTNVSDDEVIRVLRNTFPRLNSPLDRKKIIPAVLKTAEAFRAALEKGTPNSYESFIAMRDETVGNYRSVPRLLCFAIFNICPEINYYKDLETQETFRDTVSKYVMYGISDALAGYCNAKYRKNNARKDSHSRNNGRGSRKDEDNKISQMEEAIERNRMMLQDLQDEFDEQLQETKVQELTAFFAKLNSDKYGSILDSLLQVRRGIAQLKKEHFILPPEVSGLFILIQKMTQFVMDNHINPIMKPDSVLEMTAQEAERCDYTGSAFMDTDIKKRVRVVSPGWFYMDKDIVIAKPKIKEVEENE